MRQACSFSKKHFRLFQKPVPLPPTVCHAHQSMRLWGLGYPVIRQVCR
jgi:hypothetical protein